jgi:hypothetical protein
MRTAAQAPVDADAQRTVHNVPPKDSKCTGVTSALGSVLPLRMLASSLVVT